MNPTAIYSPPSTPPSPRSFSSPSPSHTTASTTSSTTGGFYLKSPSYPSTPAPHYRTNIHSSHYPPQTPPPGYVHPPPSHPHPYSSSFQQGQRYGHSRSSSNSSIYHSYQHQQIQSYSHPFPSTSMIEPAQSPDGLTGLGTDSVNSDRQVVYLDRLDVSELSRALRRARAGMGYRQLDVDEEHVEERIEEEREEHLPGYRPRGRGGYCSSRPILLASFPTTLSCPPSSSSSFPSHTNCRVNPNHIRSADCSDSPRRVSCLPSAQTGSFFTDGTSPIVCPLEDAHRSGEIDLGDGDRDAEEEDIRVGLFWIIWGLGVGLGIGSIGWAYTSTGWG